LNNFRFLKKCRKIVFWGLCWKLINWIYPAYGFVKNQFSNPSKVSSRLLALGGFFKERLIKVKT
jgi:hypothetical protein